MEVWSEVALQTKWAFNQYRIWISKKEEVFLDWDGMVKRAQCQDMEEKKLLTKGLDGE